MEIETFLHNLHFDIDKVIPENWTVDWEDAPLVYKLYRHLPVVPLSSDIPLTLERQETPVKPNLEKISHFLWYVFGLTQYCNSVSSFGWKEHTSVQLFRRFVPSGGALYPNELYIYLKLKDLPEGVYHYDVAHHRLVLVRQGNFDSYLARALGNQCDVSDCFGVIFISTMFWKNFFKYNNLSYRLQGLDAGVLIGQLLEIAKKFNFASGVYFQFIDRAVNHLLGLSDEEESVYAVIPLSTEHAIRWFSQHDSKENMLNSQLCGELPKVQHDYYIGSKRITDYPMLRKMNEASVTETFVSFPNLKEKRSFVNELKSVILPNVKRLQYDIASVCQKRLSPDRDFVLKEISQIKLAALLQEAMLSFSYRNDLDGEQQNPKPRVSLYGSFYNVEGVPSGAYYYDSAAHALRQIRSGDYRLFLQTGMAMDNVNLLQVPICLHIVGDRHHLTETLGYRGYRIQQMEAGMLVQRLLLTATAMNMGGHPLLGFDANACDDLYEINQKGKTSLIQLPIGPHRPRDWLKGSLRS
ncbi:SagB/ThcOx family dehydrogenase [Priestia megaterium]|nr:SagB/ThcOx family dehydrogenase [Priestia megaterium]